jgi:Icc-related predicted phosphoesterase
MKILSLSDTIIPFIYGPQVKRRFQGVDLLLGCGDLPYYYLEYVYDALDVPLYFVRGNHDEVVEYSSEIQRTYPHGGIDLHGKVCMVKGILLAGVEGSLRYRPGMFQYSQSEMWLHIFRLVPALIKNRLVYGRCLDVFVSHAPPAGVHSETDLPHRGIEAFRWLIDYFKPAYFIHGHIHVHRPDTIRESLVGRTCVINTFGYREIELELPAARGR